MPLLPVEIWERIIDIIAVAEDWDTDDEVRGNLHACSLTCKDWLPRSRFHLFPTLQLRSKDDPDHLAKVLSSSPVLQNRVREIRVIGSLDAEKANQQPWISLVPLQLGPYLPQLQHLHLRHIDLSKVHSSFYQFCTLFRASRKTDEPINLWLGEVLWTQFSQVQRLVSAVGGRHLTLVSLTDDGKTPFPVNDFVGSHPRILSQRCTPLRFLKIEGKRIETLNCIPWAYLLDTNPFLSDVFVFALSPPADAEWPEWVRLVRNLGVLYDRMCLSISVALASNATPQTDPFAHQLSSRGDSSRVASVTFDYPQTKDSGPVDGSQRIALNAITETTGSNNNESHTSSSVSLRRSLYLSVSVDASEVDHGDFAIAGKLLGHVMDFADRANHDLIAMVDPETLARLRGFRDVSLWIYSFNSEIFTANFPTGPWISSWAHIDDALSQPHFNTPLTRAKIVVPDMLARTILGGDDAEEWSCALQLTEVLLPNWTDSNPRVLCDLEAGKPCYEHEREQGRKEKRREEQEVRGQGGIQAEENSSLQPLNHAPTSEI